MKRISVRTGIVRSCSIAVAAIGLLLPSLAGAQDTVRHGIQIGALGALRTTLPEVGKKYDITYEIKDFGDSTAALRALDQGELQVANTTAQHLVRAIGEGMDVVWVAGWGGGYNVLVAGKGFGLKDPDDKALAAEIGKRAGDRKVKIGVPTGSMQHAKLIGYLGSIGVDAAKDVEVVNIPFPNHPRALEAGEVDLAMTLAGFGVLAIEKGGGTLVKHLFEGPFGKQEIGFIVQRSLIEKNPDLVMRIVRSHAEAMDMFIEDRDKQIEYEKAYSRFPPDVIERAERDFLRYHYRTNVPDLEEMAKLMHRLGWVKDDVSPKIDGMLDLSFLSKVTGKDESELRSW